MGDPQTSARDRPVAAVRLSRGRFLRAGLLAAAALTVAGWIYESQSDRPPPDPRYRFGFLGDEDRAIVAAIAPVMLAGAIDGPDDVELVVRGLDRAVCGLPLAVRAELRSLFALLRFAPGRMLVAGVWRPWSHADRSQVERFLSGWRASGIAQLRSAYDALHQLTFAAWYGGDRAWPAIGYPGPPRIHA